MSEGEEGRVEQVARSDSANIGIGSDSYLNLLTRIANKYDIGMGVTLNVHGTIISGQLISNKMYFEKLADNIAGASRTAANGPIIDMFVKLTKSIADNIIEARNESEEIPDEPAEFIHLSDVRMLGTDGSAIPTNNGAIWRGRINAIDGFMIGALSPT